MRGHDDCPGAEGTLADQPRAISFHAFVELLIYEWGLKVRRGLRVLRPVLASNTLHYMRISDQCYTSAGGCMNCVGVDAGDFSDDAPAPPGPICVLAFLYLFIFFHSNWFIVTDF